MTARSTLARLAAPAGEPLLVACSAPFLMFPYLVPWATALALGAIAVRWISEWATGQARGRKTPFTWPVVLLALMVTVGTWRSPVPLVSRERLAGILLGILVLRSSVAFARTPRRVWQLTALYLVVGTLLVGLGLRNMAPPRDKVWPAAGAVASQAPLQATGIPGAERGVNPNALGATTLFFIPLLCSLAIVTWRPRGRVGATGAPADAVPGLAQAGGPVARALVLLLLLAFAGVLLASQSRTALASLGGTLAVLIAVRSRQARWAMLGVLIGAAAGVLLLGHGSSALEYFLPDFGILAHRDPMHDILVYDRVGIWVRALSSIRDHPLLGVGLSAFRQVVHQPYPGFVVASWAEIPHAHNTFLQVALDAGLPGLAAYLALLIAASSVCWKVCKRGYFPERCLVLGVWGNLVAIHLFGLNDAIALGAKVGLFVWWNLGIIAALHECRRAP